MHAVIIPLPIMTEIQVNRHVETQLCKLFMSIYRYHPSVFLCSTFMDRQLILLCIGIVIFSLLIAILLTFKYRYKPVRRIHIARYWWFTTVNHYYMYSF